MNSGRYSSTNPSKVLSELLTLKSLTTPSGPLKSLLVCFVDGTVGDFYASFYLRFLNWIT